MEPIKPFNETLTSAEMGKLWTVYIGNSLAKCILSYFLQHTDDQDIKKVVENALNLSEMFVETSKEIFIQENFPIPNGFTDEDVNLGAPRLFSDEFYLHYLKYTGKAGMSIYTIAIPMMTREDIRDFFIKALHSTVNLLTEVNDLLMAKGFYIKPPQIPIPEKVDIVKKQNFLNGFLGDIRPLHALEIAHLYDNTENNLTSKALLIGFSQVTENKTIREFFIRGKEFTNKHIEISSQHLNKENLPSAPLLDHLVSESTVSPFSDKIMLAHKIEMFSMKIRSAGNAASLSGRRDLGGMYAKFIADIGLYVEDGANIMIDQGWMEQPPKAVDRDHVSPI
jgi:spore coat protein CotF